MPNMIKAHQLEHVFFNFSGSFTDGKSVARCVAIIIIFIINNGTFQGRPQDLGGGGANFFFSDLGICMSRSHAHC